MIEIILNIHNIGHNFLNPALNEGNSRWFKSLYSNKPSDRPFSCIYRDNIEYYCLCDLFHFWLIDHNVSYSLKEVPMNFGYDTCIIFEKDSDAVLFKLVWC